MKHLKKFNEVYFSSLDSEVKMCCDTGLSYLIDNGFIVGLIKYDKKYYGKKEYYYRISLRKDDEYYRTKASKEFYWNDVKDDFIAFFEYINSKFIKRDIFSNQ